MRWTDSLIRIAEHEIEGLRRRVAEITGRREACFAAVIEKLPPLMSLNSTSTILRPARSPIQAICFSA